MHGAGDYPANNKDRTMMQLREATQADLEYMAGHSISRGQKEFPVSIDVVYCLEHDGLILPDKIADTYFHIAQQHRSAWTHEMDLRSFSDLPWWNHASQNY